mmetsp:Transcript_14450/g.46642  ORF Transcript_14450/g.46642 Transcript_14450/m.46642 type:complete len:382 (+) Transcript_14450:1330-2475(+)
MHEVVRAGHALRDFEAVGCVGVRCGMGRHRRPGCARVLPRSVPGCGPHAAIEGSGALRVLPRGRELPLRGHHAGVAARALLHHVRHPGRRVVAVALRRPSSALAVVEGRRARRVGLQARLQSDTRASRRDHARVGRRGPAADTKGGLLRPGQASGHGVGAEAESVHALLVVVVVVDGPRHLGDVTGTRISSKLPLHLWGVRHSATSAVRHHPLRELRHSRPQAVGRPDARHQRIRHAQGHRAALRRPRRALQRRGPGAEEHGTGARAESLARGHAPDLVARVRGPDGRAALVVPRRISYGAVRTRHGAATTLWGLRHGLHPLRRLLHDGLELPAEPRLLRIHGSTSALHVPLRRNLPHVRGHLLLLHRRLRAHGGARIVVR